MHSASTPEPLGCSRQRQTILVNFLHFHVASTVAIFYPCGVFAYLCSRQQRRAHMSIDIPIIVIPYRNRQSHLSCLLPRLQQFQVIVVEQMDDRPFNRGALLNIGYVQARNRGATRVILHDCDLIPDDTLLAMYRESWPRRIVHFGARFRRYNNSRNYFGGVHGFEQGYFPGYPNNFWGWGGEDDALRKRVPFRHVTYARQGEYFDLEGFRYPSQKLRSLCPSQKCKNKWELLQQDNAHEDNHRVAKSVQWQVQWQPCQDNVQYGRVTFTHS